MTLICVNRLIAAIVIVIRIIFLVDRRHGQVTFLNCSQGEQPSSSAASYSSPGIVCSPDSQISICCPTACQIDITMIAPIAVRGSFSQSTACQCPKVSLESTWLSMPSFW